MQYAWLIWSLLLLVIWAIVYLSLKNKESKKEMFVVSLRTSLLGLTEPLFVSEYWSPPSLFSLALKTGFDIESLLFAFSARLCSDEQDGGASLGLMNLFGGAILFSTGVCLSKILPQSIITI